MTTRPDPRCPQCKRLAADMTELDSYWAEDIGATLLYGEDELQRQRVTYVQEVDGTYNPDNGHFWCDICYVSLGILLGMCP